MSLVLQAGSPPQGTATPALLLDAMQAFAQYMRVAEANSTDAGAASGSAGITVSDTQPGVDDQDKLWAKLDANGRFVGLYYYLGGWNAAPFTLPSYATASLPASPSAYEMVWNTTRKGLEVYRDSTWTSNLRPRGPTANRPTNVPDGYLYEDTDISRLLRYNATAAAWTTDDGAVGDVKLTHGVTEAVALARNPGWEVLSAMADKIPMGAGDTVDIGESGGRASFTVNMVRGTDEADQGTGANYITGLTVDGTQAVAPVGESMPGQTTTATVSIIPPVLGTLYLKKVVA